MSQHHEHPEGQTVVRYSLRLPRDLYDDLNSASEAGGWSMHAEILQRLRAAGKGRKRAVRDFAPPREPAT